MSLHIENQPTPALPLEPTEDVACVETACAEQTAAAAARRMHRGMSLLEIMVVITLIGLVTAAVGVAVMGQLEDGQMKTARNQAFEIEKSLDIYKLQHGTYPSSAQGLGVLASPPKGKAVMERVPKDPWGNDYIYMNPGQKNKKFDIISKGPDQQEGTEDDVGNWEEE